MHHASPRIALGAVVAMGLLVAGCGGQSGGGSQPLPKDPFAYNAAKPLLAQTTGTVIHGPVRVTELTYAAADNSRVPALLAVPRSRAPVGCLIYQPGFVPKEDAVTLWPAAAGLRLAVFTIDPRFTGARANPTAPLSQVVGNPGGLISFLRNDVVDLRRGLDYLEGQSLCHHTVGFMGISGGADLGVLLSGKDARIKAAVLCSLGATWRSALFYSPSTLPDVVNSAAVKSVVTELAPLDPARWIARISPRPVMVVDGLADPMIPPVDALDLAAAAREPKVIVLHPGGDNPFAGATADAIAAQVRSFLRQHLAGSGRMS